MTRMSPDDLRARADRWNRAFDGTNWIAFSCAGVVLLFFAWMLAIHQTAIQRLGALVGVAAGSYLAGVGVWIAGRRWVDDGATCVMYAYISRQAQRFQERIDELTRLEAD